MIIVELAEKPKSVPHMAQESHTAPGLPPKDDNQELQEIFPFFKSWNALYLFVLGELAVLILLFYLFSRAYT